MQVIRHLYTRLDFIFKNSVRYGEVFKSLWAVAPPAVTWASLEQP